MGVVVESVEIREQFDFLAHRLNGEIQGYLLSPPVPAVEFATLLDCDLFSRITGEQT